VAGAGIVDDGFTGGFVVDHGVESASPGSVFVNGTLAVFEEDAVAVRVLQLQAERPAQQEKGGGVSEGFDACDVGRGEQHVGLLAAGGAVDGVARIHGVWRVSEACFLKTWL